MSTNAGGNAAKILTIGPPCGRVKELSAKVKAINDKYGPFDALLCLGDLFTPYDREEAELSQDEHDLLDGTLKLPVPIYFALSASPLHPQVQALINERWESRKEESPVEVAPAVFYLGKTGVSTLSGGLRVAVAGGSWDASKWSESAGQESDPIEDLLNPFLTASSVRKLLDHPSFREVQPAKLVDEDEEPPQSLAAAKTQMAARAQAVQKQAEDREAQSSKPPIDILLTTTWPTGITMFSNPEKLPHGTSRMWGAPPIAQLARACQPRYHFSLAPGSCGLPDEESTLPMGIAGLDGTEEGKQLRQTGAFWEREPYRNDQPPASHPFCNTTRFISLARLANAKKQRWFMALNLVPAGSIGVQEAKSSPTAKQAVGSTPSPFSTGGYGGGASEAKRKAEEEERNDMDSGPNFRWSGHATRGGKRSKRGGGANGLPSRPDGPLPDRPRESRPLAIPVGPQDCWFCLSNPQCAKHLIVAIGTECYVAMPKGQLPPTSDPLSPVPGGGHVLIIPIEHFPSLLGHPDPDLARPIAKEMQAWRDALSKAFASFDAVPFSWEVCKTIGTRAGHMQSQVVPIPKGLFQGLEEYFREAARKWEYTFDEEQGQVRRLLQISNEEEERKERGDYVRLDFGTRTWVMPLKDRRFNLQFPRETLASYLNVPDRANWKACARSDAIETAEARAFKAAFEEFSKEVGDD